MSKNESITITSNRLDQHQQVQVNSILYKNKHDKKRNLTNEELGVGSNSLEFSSLIIFFWISFSDICVLIAIYCIYNLGTNYEGFPCDIFDESEKVLQDYECSICKDIFKEAFEIISPRPKASKVYDVCIDLFCKKCIQEWMKECKSLYFNIFESFWYKYLKKSLSLKK